MTYIRKINEHSPRTKAEGMIFHFTSQIIMSEVNKLPQVGGGQQGCRPGLENVYF